MSRERWVRLPVDAPFGSPAPDQPISTRVKRVDARFVETAPTTGLYVTDGNMLVSEPQDYETGLYETDDDMLGPLMRSAPKRARPVLSCAARRWCETC